MLPKHQHDTHTSTVLYSTQIHAETRYRQNKHKSQSLHLTQTHSRSHHEFHAVFVVFGSVFLPDSGCQKLNEYKLDDSPKRVSAEYTWQQGRLVFDSDSFSDRDSHCKGVVECPGTLLNYNTIEEFKGADKKALLAEWGDKMLSGAIMNGSIFRNPEILNSFLLITFCDLKKYIFVYWMGVPCLNTKWDLQEVADEGNYTNLSTRIPALGESFVVIDPDDNVTPFSELEYVERSEDPTIAFLSPTSPENTPWTVRNICLMLHILGFKSATMILVGREKTGFSSGSGETGSLVHGLAGKKTVRESCYLSRPTWGLC